MSASCKPSASPGETQGLQTKCHEAVNGLCQDEAPQGKTSLLRSKVGAAADRGLPSRIAVDAWLQSLPIWLLGLLCRHWPGPCRADSQP